MGILNRLFGRQTRSGDYLSEVMATRHAAIMGGASSSGMAVNSRSVNASTAYMAAVRLIATSIGTVPFNILEQKGEKRVKALTHPLWELMRWEPNPDQSAAIFWETLVGHAVSRGDGYAVILKTQERVSEMRLLNPERTEAIRIDGNLHYLTYVDNTPVTLTQDQVFHLRGFGFDRDKAVNPIVAHRNALGLSLASEEYAGQIFKNGHHIKGVVSPKTKISPDAAASFKQKLSEAAQGLANSGDLLVLPWEVEFQPVEMLIAPEEAQLLAMRQFSVQEIARIFNVPAVLLNDMSASTYNNVEQLALLFVTNSLRPWAVKLESEARRKLLRESEKTHYFFKLNMDALLRGDQKSRFEAYSIARQWGFMSTNDIRKLEDLDPIGEAGDVYLQPLNMVDAKHAAKIQLAKTGESQRVDLIRGLFEDAARRLLVKEANAIKRAIKKHEGDQDSFDAFIADFYDKHAALVRETYEPVVGAFASMIQSSDRADEILADLVKRHIDESRRQIVKSNGTLPAVVESWPELRARQFAFGINER